MSIRDWPSLELINPRGAWTLPQQAMKYRPERAFVCRNMRVNPGKIGPRDGYSSRAISVGGKVTSAFNWRSSYSNGNLVIVLESGSKIRAVNVGLNTVTDMITGLSARGLSVAEAGPRAYMATFTTAGVGGSQAYVTDGGGANDKCFEPPVQVTTWTAADNGAGQCTKGTHYFGFIFQSRSGFSGLPSPVNGGGTFVPVAFTSGPKRTVRLSLTLNTPTAGGTGSALYPIMTRSDNPNRWFYVPGVVTVLPSGAAGWSVNLDISISDEDLANRASSADDQFNMLSQSVSGTGPFNPSVVIPYNRRVVYIAGNDVYVSDINAAQNVTADLNTLTIPGGYQVVTGFAIDNALYLMGSSWTAMTEDNGNSPAQWSQPKTISGRIGTKAPLGVCSRTRGSYAWVAAEDGLYVFDGRYPDRPISYLQSDVWQRINWAAAYAVQVVDDFVNLKCYVAAPLDGATEPTHLLVYDYTNGRTFDTCDFSLDDFNAAVLFSAIALVSEETSGRTILWMMPQASGNILKQDDAAHSDNGYAIHQQYETGWLRDSNAGGQLIRIGGAHYYVKGSGSLSRTWYSKDHVESVVPTDADGNPVVLTLSATPGLEYLDDFDFAHIENASVLLETNAVDEWFEMEQVKTYYRPDMSRR